MYQPLVKHNFTTFKFIFIESALFYLPNYCYRIVCFHLQFDFNTDGGKASIEYSRSSPHEYSICLTAPRETPLALARTVAFSVAL